MVIYVKVSEKNAMFLFIMIGKLQRVDKLEALNVPPLNMMLFAKNAERQKQSKQVNRLSY
jgi:hypothetical protein